MRPIKLAPSILTADFGNLGSQIRLATEGGADYMHLDVMDGRFVPNISFGPLVVEAVREQTELPLDVHLMIEEPERYVDEFAEAGATILSVHVEATRHLHRALQRIRAAGCRAGVVLNPATPVDAVREVAGLVDMVLVMSVNPGFGGQRFIEGSYDKLRRMRALLDQHNPQCDLEVDGGVSASNVAAVVECGANVIVAGSAVYNDEDSVAANLAALRRAATEPQ